MTRIIDSSSAEKTIMCRIDCQKNPEVLQEHPQTTRKENLSCDDKDIIINDKSIELISCLAKALFIPP